jgi:predicted nucleic acid-binding protein
VIVADTTAVVALIDADDRHHERLAALFQADPDAWLLPWAILPEVDHLLRAHVGADAARAFLRDVAEGRYALDRGEPGDLPRAADLGERYADQGLGLVDAIVIAVAERHRAAAIATLDARRFGAVDIRGKPRILPGDS